MILRKILVSGLVVALCSMPVFAAQPVPKMLAYSAQPNAYFDDHADVVGGILDGLFFVVGDWDKAIESKLGLSADGDAETDWEKQLGKNIEHLRQAGATDSLLGVHFASDGEWPSPETILSKDFTAKMARHFGTLGATAERLGLRGVCIDVEYPYQRYELDHEIYTFDGYTVEDIEQGCRGQGRAIMTSVLDAFPDAVIFVLPGELWTRPLDRQLMLGMLDVMAERDAPGGFHLGAERGYCLYEYPLTQVALCREGDLAAHALLDDECLDYWQRRCTVAPGVWPLHMAETGGKNYPKQPWRDELAEVRAQMEVLRATAKRYMWCFTSHPIWYTPSSDIAAQYGLPEPSFPEGKETITAWQAILADRGVTEDPRVLDMIRDVQRFDKGALSPAELCGRLGTPGEWLMLGPLGNPFVNPAFAASGAALRPPKRSGVWHGRDGAVRWFTFPLYNPLGSVPLRAVMDWRDTDFASYHCAAVIHAEKDVAAVMLLNWDDGAIVRLNGQVVSDHAQYPERGHGLQYNDRYLFEDKVPVALHEGDNDLMVTCINAKGGWGFNIRFVDEDGFPVKALSFGVPGE